MSLTTEVLEVFFGTLGLGLVVFGLARGFQDTEKLIFVPVGLALAGFMYLRRRGRRRN